MMFSEELEKYSWDEITRRIYAKTETDVARALTQEHLQIDDFMALISPAADSYLEGPPEPNVYPTTFRQNHQHVYSVVHHQLLYELLRLLRIQP